MMNREAWEYFKGHRRQLVEIDFPDKKEREPQITEEQIEKLKKEKRSLSTRLAFEYMARQVKTPNIIRAMLL